MADNESSGGLKAKDLTDQRNDALREGIKGLFLMNGGGAAALLAFLQATWTQKPELSKYILLSISLLSIGIFLAGIVHFFRYHTSFSLQGEKIGAFKRYRFLYLAAAYGSLSAFLVGVSVVVFGAWCVLR